MNGTETKEYSFSPASKFGFPDYAASGIPTPFYKARELSEAATPAVLLCAMTGSGKSVLLEAASKLEKNIAVCIFDESDAKPDVLLSDLSAALKSALPDMPDVSAYSGRPLFDALIREAVAAHVCFVIDNCAFAEGEAAGYMAALVEAARGTCKVLLASESIPGYLLKPILEGVCKVYKGDFCALSEDDTQKALKSACKSNADLRAAAERIRAMTGGWAAGTTILARAVAEYPRSPSELASADSWRDLVADSLLGKYITYNVLAKLPEKTAAFLKKMSLAEEFSAELCFAAMNCDDAEDHIKCLRDEGVVTMRAGRIAVPTAFRMALTDMLSSVERREAAMIFASYYLKNGMYAEAVRLSEYSGEGESAYLVLKHHGAELLQKEEFAFIGRCAEASSRRRAPYDADVLGILGQYYYYEGAYGKMESCLNKADSMFGKENVYGVYRTLYKGLLRFETEPAQYLKQINNAIFFLHEYKFSLPFLREREKRVLEKAEQLNEPEVSGISGKPLTVRMFGSFSVIVNTDGRELSWRTRKGCELFAYLVSLGGDAVERGKLFDVLWEDEIPNNSVAMLHNMIYNIRKELSCDGLENVIKYGSKKYSIDTSLVESDIDDVREVCRAAETGDIKALAANARVLESCWGEYLGNVDSPWVNGLREYYNGKFVGASVMLAGYYMKEGLFEKAEKLYKNALSVDIYSEKIVGSLLECYVAMGRYDRVRAKYGEFCALIAKELEIAPGGELTEIYSRCVKRGM